MFRSDKIKSCSLKTVRRKKSLLYFFDTNLETLQTCFRSVVFSQRDIDLFMCNSKVLKQVSLA